MTRTKVLKSALRGTNAFVTKKLLKKQQEYEEQLKKTNEEIAKRLKSITKTRKNTNKTKNNTIADEKIDANDGKENNKNGNFKKLGYLSTAAAALGTIGPSIYDEYDKNVKSIKDAASTANVVKNTIIDTLPYATNVLSYIPTAANAATAAKTALSYGPLAATGILTAYGLYKGTMLLHDKALTAYQRRNIYNEMNKQYLQQRSDETNEQHDSRITELRKYFPVLFLSTSDEIKKNQTEYNKAKNREEQRQPNESIEQYENRLRYFYALDPSLFILTEREKQKLIDNYKMRVQNRYNEISKYGNITKAEMEIQNAKFRAQNPEKIFEKQSKLLSDEFRILNEEEKKLNFISGYGETPPLDKKKGIQKENVFKFNNANTQYNGLNSLFNNNNQPSRTTFRPVLNDITKLRNTQTNNIQPNDFLKINTGNGNDFFGLNLNLDNNQMQPKKENFNDNDIFDINGVFKLLDINPEKTKPLDVNIINTISKIDGKINDNITDKLFNNININQEYRQPVSFFDKIRRTRKYVNDTIARNTKLNQEYTTLKALQSKLNDEGDQLIRIIESKNKSLTDLQKQIISFHIRLKKYQILLDFVNKHFNSDRAVKTTIKKDIMEDIKISILAFFKSYYVYTASVLYYNSKNEINKIQNNSTLNTTQKQNELNILITTINTAIQERFKEVVKEYKNQNEKLFGIQTFYDKVANRKDLIVFDWKKILQDMGVKLI